MARPEKKPGERAIRAEVSVMPRYSPTLIVEYGGPFGEGWFYQSEDLLGDKKLRHFTHPVDFDTKIRRRGIGRMLLARNEAVQQKLEAPDGRWDLYLRVKRPGSTRMLRIGSDVLPVSDAGAPIAADRTAACVEGRHEGLTVVVRGVAVEEPSGLMGRLRRRLSRTG